MGTFRREGYRVEKVIFESRPGHHVTASFYVPEGKPPYPGVLLPCGHSDNGKAYDQYQRAAILLAKNGMAVLCYDPIGQGERYQRLDAQGKPVVRGTAEHTMAGIGALLVGRQEASYAIWDGLRALDYLAGRSEVDPRRLGCTGNSGGGTLTAYLMALDDRIAVAAPSCYITSLERLFATIGPQDAEQNITGQVAAGMEHADYVTMRAPKPTLLTVGTRDFFDIQGSWDTFREVKLIYGRLGFGERGRPVRIGRAARLHRARGGSRPPAGCRGGCSGGTRPSRSPSSSIASDADLQCTRSGQVLIDFKDKSVFDLNAERANELREAREAANARRSDAEFRAEVRKLIGLGDLKIAAAKPRVVGTLTARGRTIRKLVFDVEPGIVVPALDFMPPGDGLASAIVVKAGVDWARDFAEPGKMDELLESRSGHVVLIEPCEAWARPIPAPSPGATGRSAATGRRRSWASTWRRPLLGQRVVDVLSVLEGLKAEQGDGTGFHLVGVGAAGPVVLHAALLDEKGLVKEVTLERSLTSWEDLVKQGISRDQLGNVVPGALRVYDLARAGGPRWPRGQVHIVEPVDASGQPASGSKP